MAEFSFAPPLVGGSRVPLLSTITDQEALDILPPEGFFRDYVTYAREQVTAGAAFHVGGAISLLSSMLPHEFEIRCIDPRRPLVGPLWVLLVGRSGIASKSRCLAIPRMFLRELGGGEDADGFGMGPVVSDPPGSVEGLLDSLEEAPCQTVHYSDLARFLSHSNSRGGGYGAGLRDMLLEVFDGGPVGERLANGRGRSVDNVRMTILAGVAPTHIQRHTSDDDWDGGFMNRWLILRAEPERLVARAKHMPDMERQILDTLDGLVQRPPGVCGAFTPEAAQLWDAFRAHQFKHQAGNFYAATTARADITAVRLGVFHAISCGKHSTSVWHLDAESLSFGIRLSEWYRRGMAWGLSGINTTRYQRTRSQLLEFMRDTEVDTGRTENIRSLAEISAHLRIPKRDLSDLLESLVEEGLLVMRHLGAMPWLYLRDEDQLLRQQANQTPPMANGGVLGVGEVGVVGGVDVSVDADVGMDGVLGPDEL